jgi:mono/diheme cytochrome c family protein
LSHAGYFTSPATNINTLRALASETNSAYSVEYRVHSYLAANCSQCHRPGGAGLGAWDARIVTPLSQAGIINGLLYNDFGDTNNHVIAPLSLAHSILFRRISTRGSGQMPPLDSTVLDTNAINLLNTWITSQLAGYQSFADWQLTHFGSATTPDAGLDADPDADGAQNWLEYLTGTDPLSAQDVWDLSVRLRSGIIEIAFPQIANLGFQVEWTSSLTQPVVWQPLDAPGNSPAFPAANSTSAFEEPVSAETLRFYRVRVLQP